MVRCLAEAQAELAQDQERTVATESRADRASGLAPPPWSARVHRATGSRSSRTRTPAETSCLLGHSASKGLQAVERPSLSPWPSPVSRRNSLAAYWSPIPSGIEADIGKDRPARSAPVKPAPRRSADVKSTRVNFMSPQLDFRRSAEVKSMRVMLVPPEARIPQISTLEIRLLQIALRKYQTKSASFAMA